VSRKPAGGWQRRWEQRAPGILHLAVREEPQTFGEMVPIPDESNKDVGEPTKFRRQEREPERLKGEPDVSAHPTPIRISRRTRTALILAALVALALEHRVDILL